MADIMRIAPKEVKRLLDQKEKIFIIDIRNTQAWGESKSKLPGAFRLTFEEVDKKLSQIPTDRPIVTYCT